jgi:hypothetical protein
VIHTIISLGSNPQLIQQAAAVVLVPEAEKKSEIRQAAGIWMILTVEAHHLTRGHTHNPTCRRRSRLIEKFW